MQFPALKSRSPFKPAILRFPLPLYVVAGLSRLLRSGSYRKDQCLLPCSAGLSPELWGSRRCVSGSPASLFAGGDFAVRVRGPALFQSPGLVRALCRFCRGGACPAFKALASFMPCAALVGAGLAPPVCENGLPSQNLIDLYFLDCAKKRKKLTIKWVA